jgi:hypothetical protein
MSPSAMAEHISRYQKVIRMKLIVVEWHWSLPMELTDSAALALLARAPLRFLVPFDSTVRATGSVSESESLSW